MKKILLSFCGIIALIGCMAISSSAFALEGSGGISENSYEGDVTAAYCADDASSFITPDLSGQVALVASDLVGGMILDFAANVFEKDYGYITPVGYLAEGGDATPYSKALHPS